MSEQLRKRRLTRDGLQVTEIGVGLWAAGGDQWGETDDQEIGAAIDGALEAGINFFDTADVYGNGHSETLLGWAMNGRREKFVVASKIGWVGFDGERQMSAYTTVDKAVAAVESALGRLQTTYVDVMQWHVDFAEPTLDIFIAAMEQLKAQGRIRAWGISTSDFNYIKRANAAGGMNTLQIDYSILNRTPEQQILPYCLTNGIGVIVRGPLAMGILTGKYSADTRFEQGDFRARWHDNPDEYAIFQDDLAKVEKLKALLPPGRTLTQLALQFVLAHPAVSTAIPGAKNVDQVAQNVSAGRLPPLETHILAAIDGIVPPGGGRRIWPA